MNFTPNTEGIFPGLPEDIYRAAPGISQSLVKKFAEHKTPEHFQTWLTKPKKPTPEMEFGTVVHAHILQPERSAESYHLRPEEYPAEVKKVWTTKPWSGNSDWCKDWLASHQDRPVMKREKVDKIPAIVEKVNAIKEGGSVIVNGEREVSFFKRDTETGLLLKARVDAIATDESGNTWIVDVKTTMAGGAAPDEFNTAVFKRGYHIQEASYLYVTGASRFFFVAVETEEPFGVMQHTLDADWLRIGYDAWRVALRAYAECLATNTWPSYPLGINTLSPPRWLLKQAA